MVFEIKAWTDFPAMSYPGMIYPDPDAGTQMVSGITFGKIKPAGSAPISFKKLFEPVI